MKIAGFLFCFPADSSLYLSDMNRKSILSLMAVLLLSFSPSLLAGPRHLDNIPVRQPDGSLIRICVHGDEYLRIVTTSDGVPVICGSDGWWYYARYDGEGVKHSTGIRVGQGPAAPADIPLDLLKRAAREGKREAGLLQEVLRPRFPDRKATRTEAGLKNTGTVRHGLVILAAFSDVPFQPENTRSSFNAMLNQSGYSTHGGTGCANDYFRAQFGSDVTFQFTVSGIVPLDHPREYYGKNINNARGKDIRPEEMIVEACRKADSQIDFSQFDDNGDGVVDNVFVFFAGKDESEGGGDDCLWSHAYYVASGSKHLDCTLDGVKIDRYACTSELGYRESRQDYMMAGIGTFCHEYTHTFGIPDYYDTDYAGSDGLYYHAGLWTYTALMDGGNRNNDSNTPPFYNGVSRFILSRADLVEIDHEGEYVLEPVSSSNRLLYLPTEKDGEFFLFECRSNDGWDRFIGGKGLLVYHIDGSDNEAGYSETYQMDMSADDRWQYNQINANPEHPCARVIPADGRRDKLRYGQEFIYQDQIAGLFYPAGSTSLSNTDLVSWGGVNAEYALTDIRLDGDNVRFTAVRTGTGSTPYVNGYQVEDIFQTGAVITWNADVPAATPSYIAYGKSGGSLREMEVLPAEPGKYTFTLEGLSPLTTYRVELYFKKDSVPGAKTSFTFSTPKQGSENRPFIYLKGLTRNPDDTFPAGTRFPLQVYNVLNADHVSWFWNGRPLSTESVYFTPTESGTLRATVFYKDGSIEHIVKTIHLK